MKDWSETLTLATTLLSTGVGLELIRWIITRWSAMGDAELLRQAKLREEQRQDQISYYEQLRADYKELRDEHRLLHTTLLAIEGAHRECEGKLLETERENIEQRQKLQLLQLRFDEIEQRMEKQQVDKKRNEE